MRTKSIGRTMGLLFSAGLATLAGGYAECAAQTRAESEQERLSLSAAIEEALRSPFHAGAEGEPHEPRLSETGIGGATWHQPQESESQEEEAFRGPPFGLYSSLQKPVIL